MIYRLADKDDLPRLLSMVEQAKVSFRARGIGQWQKGDRTVRGFLRPSAGKPSMCWMRKGRPSE